MATAKQLLTHSRQSSFKVCRRKHHYSYNLGLRRETDSKALRMGSAFHGGVEALGNGADVETACTAARACYGECPLFLDPYEWECEQETVLRLVCCYAWRWSTMPLEYVAVERSFELPLLNPKTGKPSRQFNLAGKIDAIVRLEDGRLAVKETKLLGDDIGQDSALWRRLRLDQQISMYISAARRLGFPVETVLYDVARKPTISATAVPVLDELGIKIVLDAHGDRVKTEKKQWRQTADKERGYVLQTRPMTTWEWGEKLSADVVERPDYYFARQEITRLDKDLAEYQGELWDIAQQVADAQKNNRHYRTVSKDTCSWCEYFSLCETGAEVGQSAPEGFVFLTDLHPELERTNGNSISTPETPAESTTAPAGFGESYW